MSFLNFCFRGLMAFIILQFSIGSAAYAQTAAQTWVSGFGSDAGACSFAAPCKTLAAALTKTNAGGEISIDSTGELGIATINKSITINAVGALGSIVVPSGANGITVAAGANDIVILRGLTLNGGGVGINGVLFTSGARLHVENCTFSRFSNEGILFQPTSASGLYVNNVSVKSNAKGGAIHIQPAAGVTTVAHLNNLKSEANYRGVRAEDGSKVVVRNSIVTGSIAGNAFNAYSAANGIIDFTIENSVSSGNAASGVQASGANATVRLSNVTITGNANGINSVNGGKIISFGNNKVHGNLSNTGGVTLTPQGQI